MSLDDHKKPKALPLPGALVDPEQSERGASDAGALASINQAIAEVGQHPADPKVTLTAADAAERRKLIFEVLGDQLSHHEQLLSAGWTVARWKHPTLGDMEVVVPDGFWISTLPDGSISSAGPSDRFAAAVAEGRTVFRRDGDGNLMLLRSDGK